MDRTQQKQKLYQEFAQINDEMRPYVTAQSADNPKTVSASELEHYFRLRKRLGEIIAELTEVEGPPHK
jgi:hypothetical protein